MKIKELRYDRKFFLGNYRTEGIGVMVELAEGEDPAAKLLELKAFVEASSIQGKLQAKALKLQNAAVDQASSLTEKLKNATTEVSKKRRKAQALPKQEELKAD